MFVFSGFLPLIKVLCFILSLYSIHRAICRPLGTTCVEVPETSLPMYFLILYLPFLHLHCIMYIVYVLCTSTSHMHLIVPFWIKLSTVLAHFNLLQYRYRNSQHFSLSLSQHFCNAQWFTSSTNLEIINNMIPGPWF